ncbi:MAG: hypothetical protein AAGF95_30325 [Chloroflexota bacterium]
MSSLFAFNNTTVMNPATITGYYDTNEQLWVAGTESQASSSPDFTISTTTTVETSVGSDGSTDVGYDFESDLDA